MPEQLVARVPEQLRRMMGSLICVLPLCGVTGVVFAQSVPPGLRACAADPDSARRLACYDREMARLLGRPAPSAATPASPNADLPSSAAPQSAAELPSSSAPPPRATVLPSSAPTQAPQAAATTSASPQPASPETSAPHHRLWPWKIFASDGSGHVTAHIASLDRWPDTMVVHLDNGQAWQQIGRVAGDLTLRVGDSVTIEKHLGSYWLSSLHVSDMKVRLKSQ